MQSIVSSDNMNNRFIENNNKNNKFFEDLLNNINKYKYINNSKFGINDKWFHLFNNIRIKNDFYKNMKNNGNEDNNKLEIIFNRN